MLRDHPTWVKQRRRELGARIRGRRLHANLTQEKLSDRSGVDRRTLQRIESGESDPRYGDLLLIAEALGLPLAELVG
ncbi:transcriptional regulator with XRE-family HTH domain [Streptomyces sp. PvR006]|uniref:helix-turn-helix domain-containing protein n=1 Tax=Streptomyces sp. PvR006 TaxID=2817860 RepID=UPI001AE3423E|nr:helix-turn-helix transcriptional regulator [Streptomyces sp. PvR006]MBP2583413.1 transcriptional regulator with XRE-family HTH domain [Streptomyces sp. PvR006]